MHYNFFHPGEKIPEERELKTLCGEQKQLQQEYESQRQNWGQYHQQQYGMQHHQHRQQQQLQQHHMHNGHQRAFHHQQQQQQHHHPNPGQWHIPASPGTTIHEEPTTPQLRSNSSPHTQQQQVGPTQQLQHQAQQAFLERCLTQLKYLQSMYVLPQ
ncbi:sex-determining region Y protein-like [Musca domestica]|uniref:Sex-determining region Y protein-like n=1 Tax=Musca domestica TaxID=7370 RepID=A0A1I8N8G5_MUSDO|nr:sex-determining region Y protein-like [Musca domestica]